MSALARPPLVFSRAHGRLAIGLALAFAALVAAHIHGYSISMWHEHLDGSPPAELLWGKPQWLRMDDWMVQIPTSLSQRAHDPHFPVWNEKIGLGQNMLVPFQLPVAHPLLLLRPFEWGWLLGPDTGMAWRWWLEAFGLFACVFLLLEIVGGGRFWLSVAGSLVLVYSPFFQFWSLNASPFVCYAALLFVSGCEVLFTQRRLVLWLNALVLGWSAAAFLLSFYPPYQIVLAQILVLLFATTLFERVRSCGWPEQKAERAAALAIAALVAIGAAALTWRDAGEALSVMQRTAYPGGRLAVGGGRQLWQIFLHDCFVAPVVVDWGPLQNILQAASFWLLFPVVGAGLMLRTSRRGARVDAMAFALLGYCIFLVAYSVRGLPLLAARVLFLGSVPTERAVIGLGVAEVLLLVRFLATRSVPECESLSACALALLWGAAIGGVGWMAHGSLPGIGTAWLVGAAAANACVAYALLRTRHHALAVGTLAAVGFACTAWFNPVVRGGSAYLETNSVSQAIRELDAEGGGNTTWLVFNTDNLGNLFRALGIRSLSGVFPVPQLLLWQRLDPTGAQAQVYNRYANVSFLPKGSPGADFRLLGPDVFIVYLPTDAATLRQLGVTNVVFKSERRDTWDRLPGLVWQRSAGRFHFYRVASGLPGEAAASPGADAGAASRDRAPRGTGDGGG